jgi:hypothetical protein
MMGVRRLRSGLMIGKSWVWIAFDYEGGYKFINTDVDTIISRINLEEESELT